MSTFHPTELLALDPPTLYGLLEIAPGDTVTVKAAYLGLDCAIPSHAAAVAAAWPIGWQDQFSPPIGAGQNGVRSDLTPTGPDDVTPDDDQDDDPSTALGLPQPDASAAAEVAELLAESARTGQPFMAGTFAIYAVPDGTLMIVTEDQNGEVKRHPVPKKIVRMGLGLMAGKRMSLRDMFRRG